MSYIVVGTHEHSPHQTAVPYTEYAHATRGAETLGRNLDPESAFVGVFELGKPGDRAKCVATWTNEEGLVLQ